MATPMKRVATPKAEAVSNGERRFPAECYEYDDDVTPEAVEAVREKASVSMNAEQWDVVDGFGLDARPA